MISYAQNHEDVLLHRVFRDVSVGYYVDVGAAHPEVDSVTRWFYDQGWRGVNVEPRPDMFALLQTQRPRDVNLQIGLSDRPGRLRFFQIHSSGPDADAADGADGGGLSTFDEALARRQRDEGCEVRETNVAVRTLNDVLQEHEPPEITFLKVDVEGHERQVLEGLDWRRFRPRVVLAEATLPRTDVPSHGDWEPLLLDNGYLFAAFDGLNRYYVRREDRELLPRFQAPVSVLDYFTPLRVVQLRNELALARAELQFLRDERERRRNRWPRRIARLFDSPSRWLGLRRSPPAAHVAAGPAAGAAANSAAPRAA